MEKVSGTLPDPAVQTGVCSHAVLTKSSIFVPEEARERPRNHFSSDAYAEVAVVLLELSFIYFFDRRNIVWSRQ